MASQKPPKESAESTSAAKAADAKSTSAQTLQAASEAASQAEQHKGLSKVSKGVFFVGVALALVLGIYVGSLVPSMFSPEPAPQAAVQQAALDTGAMGASISGAGPSVFAWCETEAQARIAAEAMAAAFADAGFGSDRHLTPIAAPAAGLLS